MNIGNKQQSIRCLTAKVGLNSHDRGAHVIARAFHETGFEAIYSRLHKSLGEIVRAAVQEEVASLLGTHDTLVPKITDGLKEGVAAIFGPITSAEETIEFVHKTALER